MFAENILKLINFNVENFDSIQTFLYIIIALSIILIVFWLVKDISSRIENKYLRVFLFLVVVFTNIAGFLFYLVLRPRETTQEKSERVMIGKTQETILLDNTITICPGCDSFNKRDFKYCVNCGRELKLACPQCKYAIQHYWNYCPGCKAILNAEEKVNIEKWNIFWKATTAISDLILNLIVKIIVTVVWIYKLISNKLDSYVHKFNSHWNLIGVDAVNVFPKHLNTSEATIHKFEDLKDHERAEHKKSNKKKRKRRKRK
jgi:hypothetical protein